MQSQDYLEKLENLLKKGKILGYQIDPDGVIILAFSDFSNSEAVSLGLNIKKVITVSKRLEALT
jgi:hypothetical protein